MSSAHQGPHARHPLSRSSMASPAAANPSARLTLAGASRAACTAEDARGKTEKGCVIYIAAEGQSGFVNRALAAAGGAQAAPRYPVRPHHRRPQPRGGERRRPCLDRCHQGQRTRTIHHRHRHADARDAGSGPELQSGNVYLRRSPAGSPRPSMPSPLPSTTQARTPARGRLASQAPHGATDCEWEVRPTRPPCAPSGWSRTRTASSWCGTSILRSATSRRTGRRRHAPDLHRHQPDKIPARRARDRRREGPRGRPGADLTAFMSAFDNGITTHGVMGHPLPGEPVVHYVDLETSGPNTTGPRADTEIDDKGDNGSGPGREQP